MLALAQPDLEANQLLPLNKGLESQIEMTSNLQAVCSHLRQPYYGDKNNQVPTEF